MNEKRRNARQAALALFLSVLVWPLVWLGLYRLHSAPLAFLFYHALCIVGGFLLRPATAKPAEPPGPHWRLVVAGAVVTANVAAFLLYRLLGTSLFDRDATLARMANFGLAPASYALLFPYFALVNPLAEEWFWRAGVYRTLRTALGDERRETIAAALLAAALFGAWHWLTVRLFVAPLAAVGATLLIAAIGFAFTVVYARTQRLVYPVLLHALGGDVPLLMILLLIHRG